MSPPFSRCVFHLIVTLVYEFDQSGWWSRLSASIAIEAMNEKASLNELNVNCFSRNLGAVFCWLPRCDTLHPHSSKRLQDAFMNLYLKLNGLPSLWLFRWHSHKNAKYCASATACDKGCWVCVSKRPLQADPSLKR